MGGDKAQQKKRLTMLAPAVRMTNNAGQKPGAPEVPRRSSLYGIKTGEEEKRVSRPWLVALRGPYPGLRLCLKYHAPEMEHRSSRCRPQACPRRIPGS